MRTSSLRLATVVLALSALALAPARADTFLEDSFADLSNWDNPPGINLQACVGVPAAPVGTFQALGNRLLITPGIDLGFGAPIGFTGLKTSAAASFVGQPSYRIRFDTLAQGGDTQAGGIVQAFYFVGQHYDLDGNGLFVPTGSAGIGFTMSFDCPNDFDDDCDHVHPYNQSPCLQEANTPEPDDVFFPGFLSQVNTRYTVIMDADGNEHEGPFTLQVKIFPAGDPEPADYMGTWKLPTGINPTPTDAALNHGFLAGAIGAANRSIEISNFSVCEVPLPEKHVRCLECILSFDPQGITVRWDNPFDAADEEIMILVNGAVVATVDSTATEHVITNLPQGDIVIEVVNYSGVAARCEFCVNDAPVAAIEGPTTATPEEAAAGIALDGAGSSDPEGTDLSYAWSIFSSPPGSSPTIDGADTPTATFRTDLAGEYAIKLTVNDMGCPLDVPAIEGLPLSDETILGIEVTPAGILFVRGDADGTGEVPGTTTDIIVLANYLFLGGDDPPCLAAADINGDGGVPGTTTDIIYLANFLFLGGEEPPAPGPRDCGLGTAADEKLGCLEHPCMP